MDLFTGEFSLWSALFIWCNPSQHSRQVALNSRDQGQQLLWLPSVIFSSCILTTGSGQTVCSLYWYICTKYPLEDARTPTFVLVWCLSGPQSWAIISDGPQMSSVPLPSKSTNRGLIGSPVLSEWFWYLSLIWVLILIWRVISHSINVSYFG